MTKPKKSYGKDRTEPIKSITLDSFSVLSYRVMARYRNRDYGEYRFVVNIAMDVLNQMPKKILDELVKSDFLLDKKEVNK